MKFKKGDYIAQPQSIILPVEAAIEASPGGDVLYALFNHKTNALNWHSEFELVSDGFEVVTPDFDLWRSIKVGEMIKTGLTDERGYVRVLVRLEDLVMYSMEPLTQKQRKSLDDLASKLEELTDGELTKQDVKAEIKQFMPFADTSAAAYKTASGTWRRVEQLALMNWRLLRE